jgi:alkylated DNA repair dioxygenase AlkB
VVSISLGDTARFLFGGATEGRGGIAPAESGDAFVSAALRAFATTVSRIVPGTAPPDSKMAGRFN